MDMVSTLHNFRGSRPKPSSSARPTLWHCGERKTNCCSVSPPTGQHVGEEMDVDERGQRTPFCHRHTERRGTPHKEIPHAHIISPFHENALTPTTANNPSAFPHCSLLSSPPLFFATVWTRKASPPPRPPLWRRRRRLVTRLCILHVCKCLGYSRCQPSLGCGRVGFCILVRPVQSGFHRAARTPNTRGGTFKGSPFSSLSLSAYSKTRGRKEEAPSLLSLSPLLTLPGACHTQTAYTARILVRPRRTEDGLEEEGKRRRRRKEALSLSPRTPVL